MAKTLNVQDFFKMFPDDEACLEHLFKTRFKGEVVCPRCGQIDLFRKLASRPAYTCNCGHHIYPMVGTPFEDSRTPLQKWFYAMYLFTTSRHGVPAKELQRQLGVTYKCAWRMGHMIRKYMGKVDTDGPLSGIVEIDETYVGGKKKGVKAQGRGTKGKTIVFGMLERGGEIVTKVVPDIKSSTLYPFIGSHIEPGTEIHTDELSVYSAVKRSGYTHKQVKHNYKEYVSRDGTTHVNSIEGFWSQIKRSIRGTHIHVSSKHMAKYLGEFEFRYNMRKSPELMFSSLLKAF
jgi:transposase